MSNCCNCTYHIEGCFNICYPIALDLPNIEDGNYTVTVADSYYSFTATAADGVLTIPANVLNEADCVTIQIAGYKLTEGEQTYNCFKINTTYSTTIAGGDSPQPPDDQCNCDTLYNADGNIDGVDRLVELLNDASLRIREQGVHSFQIGADVPVGMIPIPNLKFSGFTGSNANDSLITLNGMIKGLPNTDDIYLPGDIVIKGDPFNGNGVTIINQTVSNGGVYTSTALINTIAFIFVDKIFDENGNYFLFDQVTSQIKWQLSKYGSIRHSGAYANKPTRYTAGGNHTIPDNVSVYIYDPAVIQAGATITLPANPLDGQDLYIIGGGTITSGNVITGFTLDGNGRTVIGDGGSTLKVGKAYELHYCGENNIWYAIAF